MLEARWLVATGEYRMVVLVGEQAHLVGISSAGNGLRPPTVLGRKCPLRPGEEYMYPRYIRGGNSVLPSLLIGLV